MSKVIQVRGVPDDVHAKLVAAAEVEGKSLTQYLAAELERLAYRADVQWHNAQVIRQARAKITSTVKRVDVQKSLDEGRAERDAQLTRGLE